MAEKNTIGCLVLSLCFVSFGFAATCQSTSSLQSSSGTIRGPGYPGNYPNNAVYCWRIYVPSNYVVRLTINTLNMEVCTGCSCDSIELFNGYSESSSRIGKVCSKSWSVTSSGRYLFVKFTSDSTGTGTAFKASYYRLYKGSGSNTNNNNNYNNNNDNSKNDNSGISFGVKIGIGAGGGGSGLFILCCLYYCCCRGN